MPLDEKPVADGNVVLIDGRAHVLSSMDGHYTRYKSHFATCPQAASWRRR